VYWDSTACTPYAYQSSTKKYLSYDNAKSLKDKVDYVNQQSLGGVMVWSLEMDDSSNTLLSSLQSVRK
jgi:chitinase